MLQEQPGSDSMYDSDYNDAASDLAAPEKPITDDQENERPDSAEVDGEWGMLVLNFKKYILVYTTILTF